MALVSRQHFEIDLQVSVPLSIFFESRNSRRNPWRYSPNGKPALCHSRLHIFFFISCILESNKDSGSCLDAEVPDTKMTSEIFSDRWASVTRPDHLQIGSYWTCAVSDNKIKDLR